MLYLPRLDFGKRWDSSNFNDWFMFRTVESLLFESIYSYGEHFYNSSHDANTMIYNALYHNNDAAKLFFDLDI